MAVRPQTDISANSGTKNKSTTKGVVCSCHGPWYGSIWTILKFKIEKIYIENNTIKKLTLSDIVYQNKTVYNISTALIKRCII